MVGSTRLRSMAAYALVLTLTAAFTGCSGDDEPDAAPTETSTSSEPPESSAATSAPTEQPPALPAEAQGDDDASAIAFVEHWVDLLNFAFTTGDTEPARALAPNCELCNEALDGVDSSASDEVGWQLSDVEVVPIGTTDPAGTDRVVFADVTTNVELGAVGFGLSRGAAWEIIWIAEGS